MKKRLLRALVLLGLLACLLPVSAAAEAWNDGDPTTIDTDVQTPRFSDVAETDWYYTVVTQLAESGTIDGYPDGTFRPQNTVTTGQALKMILLAAGYAEPERTGTHWARGYLDLAIEEGFVTRFKEITDLDVPISRELVAQIAARAIGLQRPDTLVSPFTDSDNDEVVALSAVGIVGGYKDGTFKPQKSLTRAELSAITARILDYLAPLTPSDPSEDEPAVKQTLRTTEAGVDFIKAREGFRSTAFWDYSQYSIGYGSRCEQNEYPNGITQEQADTLLREKLKEFETKLDAFLEKNGLTLTDTQYDALISLTYNIGATWMNGSRLAQCLTARTYSHNEFASAMGVWCHVTEGRSTVINDGLIARRILEIKLFLYGDYTGTASANYSYVRFETDRGSMDVDIAFYETGTAFSPYYSAACAGDVFLGWYTIGGAELREGDIVTGDMTVTAAWQGSGSIGGETTVPDDGPGGFWS